MFLQEHIFACEATIPNPVHSENMSDCWRSSKRIEQCGTGILSKCHISIHKAERNEKTFKQKKLNCIA